MKGQGENESEGQDKENRSHSDWFLQRGMRHEREGGATTVCLVATWYTERDLLCVQNREMHDQMEYCLGEQRSNSYLSTERNPQIVYR